MAPTINTGDIVVLQRLHAPAQVGDIALIHVPDAARKRYGYPDVVIHRVKAIAPDGTVTSQGDAREEEDPFTVPLEMLTTRVVAHLPAAGKLMGYFTSPLGLIWLTSGLGLLFGAPLVERRRHDQDAREDRSRALEEAIQATANAQALLAEHVAALPAQIARAVASAVAAVEPPAPEPVVIPARPVPPTPPVPKRAPTPDLIGILARPAAEAKPLAPESPATPELIGSFAAKPRPPRPSRLVAASAWDAPPPRKRFTPSGSHGVLCAVPA